MLRPGDRLGDRYEVIEQIAAGGMGTLWRAHHLELDVDVALKVVSARGASPTSLKRFKREAQAAAKLRSPNIVQVLDYGEFEGQPYLAMELLRGEDLASRIDSEGKIPFDRCARILDGVAKAVQLAHDAGIVHRDLKPANIFLEKIGDDEVVKILDFGIAKDLAAVADPGSTTGAGVVGSPAYMSPEQVWAKKIGNRADVWAMGVVAFEMLTGKNPFHDETLAKIFERIIRDPIPKLSDFEAGLPPALDAFFERALARLPTDRIGSAREFAEQLHGAIDGLEPPPAPRFDAHARTEQALVGPRAAATLRRRDRGGAGRKRRLVILGGVAALALVVVLLVGSKGGQPPKTQREGNRPIPETPAHSGLTPTRPPDSPVQGARPTEASAPSSLPVKAPPALIGSVSATSNSLRPGKPPLTPTPRSSSSSPSMRLDPRFGIPVNH